MFEILREIDPRHSAAAELALDSITAAKNIGQRGLQLVADQLIEDSTAWPRERHLAFAVGDGRSNSARRSGSPPDSSTKSAMR
jgi:hypothetical protein